MATPVMGIADANAYMIIGRVHRSTHNTCKPLNMKTVVRAAIIINSADVILGWITHAEAAEHIETFFLLFFLTQLVVELYVHGWRWLLKPTNMIDAAITMAALLPIFGESITIIKVARLARLFHFARHTTHLKLHVWLSNKLTPITEALAIRATH